MNSDVPLPSESFIKIVTPWIDIINSKECGSIINLSRRTQLYRIHQFLENKQLLEDKVKNFEAIQFISLDIPTLLLQTKQDFDNYVDTLCDKTKRHHVFFLIDSDKLIQEERELLGFFDSLYINKSVTLLYFFQHNITLPHIRNHLSSFSSLFKNIHAVPLPSPDDVNYFIDYMEHKFNKKFPPNVKKKIAQECGGRLWLTMEAVRYYAKTADTKGLFSHEEMQLKLTMIWNEFDPVEQNVLTKVVKNDLDFKREELEILKYFLKINLIKKLSSRYVLAIALLQNYISQTIRETTKLSLNKNQQLMVNEVVIEGLFSRRENKLLRYALSHPEEIIMRQQAARLLWGEKYEQEYTDWALDQAIRRLREKLEKLGLSRKLVKTVKNKGFVLLTTYGN